MCWKFFKHLCPSIPWVKAESVSPGVMDDQYVTGLNFGQLNILDEEVALEAERPRDVVRRHVMVARLDDAVLVGDSVAVTPLSRVVNFPNELQDKVVSCRVNSIKLFRS